MSLLSAVLLSAAWYWHLSFLIFFGFVPLLIIEDRIASTPGLKRAGWRLFGFSYLAFLLWNILVTWWVVYASFSGACMAFIFNSLFMALVFVLFSKIKKRIAKPWALWLLIPLWLAWEYGHTLWDLTWTWLTIGNVFSFNHHWVQWYEITGVSGGSAWALAVNIIVFKIYQKKNAVKIFSRPLLTVAAWVLVPIFVSYLVMFLRVQIVCKPQMVKTLIVQPNIDPYNDKFNWDFKYQFDKMYALVKDKVNAETDYLVMPETFITNNLNEEGLNQSEDIAMFRDSLIKKFPKLKIVTGANTYVIYDKQHASATARPDERGFYYDVFNTALQIDASKTLIYHKSKLVPGVERMPFPALLKPLESFAIDLGGTMGSLGVQDEPGVFHSKDSVSCVAPVICYESIFADYTAGYIRKGANLIFIITNDGWWDNTPGYTQHLNYARLRAIENRREIARCANTGISCFIDRYGNTSSQTEWWKEATIEDELLPNDSLTFFARFGDLLSYISVVISLLLVALQAFMMLRKKASESENAVH